MGMRGVVRWGLLLVGCSLLAPYWGCAHNSAAVRKARLKKYPKIPSRVANSMYRDSMYKFRRGFRGTPSTREKIALWRKMIHEVRPLMVSLSSDHLRRFSRTVRRYGSMHHARYHRLPLSLREELSVMRSFAYHRRQLRRRAALRALRRARYAIKVAREAILEEKSGVSKKILRRKRRPKRLTRRASKRRYPSLGVLYPMPGHRPGSRYGWRRSPISKRWRFHTGLDIGARRGTPILAAASGVVVRARYMGSCGYGVILKHKQYGYKRVTTTYCHMSRILVRRKQRIRRGQKIGRIGSTGNSTGPHLHFAIHINRRHVNPMHHFRSIE